MSEKHPSMSLAGRLMPTVMRLRRANKNHLSREHVRRHLEELTVRPRPVNPPKRLRKNITVTAARELGWRIYTVSPSHTPVRGTVVYLHGGSWIHEASPTHWKWVQQIADEASVSVIMPAYPLVHEDGTAATVVPRTVELCEQSEGPVVLMGDSAGGSIAMSASLLLAQRRAPVALTVLISPALDLRFSNPEIDVVQPSDPWLVKKGQIELAEMWVGKYSQDPIFNPFLGELHGLGRLVVFSGTRDILNPDTRLFVRNAKEAGADIDYYEQPGHIHVYPLLPTPEGRQARRTMIEAIKEAVSAHNPSAPDPEPVDAFTEDEVAVLTDQTVWAAADEAGQSTEKRARRRLD